MTDLDTSGVALWPQWCYSVNQADRKVPTFLAAANFNNNNNNNNNLLLKNHSHVLLRGDRELEKDPDLEEPQTSRMSPAGSVKKERLSPDPGGDAPRSPATSSSTAAAVAVSMSVSGPHHSNHHLHSSRQATPTGSHHSGTPSPSVSPRSPASSSSSSQQQQRTRTPSSASSYPGTPPHPHPALTPSDRFSPAAQAQAAAAVAALAMGVGGGVPGLAGGHNGLLKHAEPLTKRNYSDYMRCLAAKYNTEDAAALHRGAGGGGGGANGFLGRSCSLTLKPPAPYVSSVSSAASSSSSSSTTSSSTSSSRLDSVVSLAMETKKSLEPHCSSAVAVTPTALPHTGLPHTAPGAPPPPLFNPATSGLPGFPGFPLMDMSSTQVLLNMVRNASAAQQSQLENYLRGAMKRPADAPPTSPLDLSGSVAAKRLRTDSAKSFDVKSFFNFHTEDDKKNLSVTSTSHNSSSSTFSNNNTTEAKGMPLGRSPSTSPPGAHAATSLLTPISAPVKSQPAAAISPGRGASCSDRNCSTAESIAHWTVEDVCAFVAGIDLCAEYVQAFRDQRIDGSALALLTEEHLTTSIHMRLGPALKLRSVLAKRLGACGVCLHCDHCHAAPQPQHLAPLDARRPPSASSLASV
ncbi:uncharacterized protein LOC143040039 [Oratosquilla oratoria]|uniref:uncharacterized protein LOC143040039 n=1 Tax=Oratosquilla oratoria TaxID=337810 RepID=UPI003F760CCB